MRHPIVLMFLKCWLLQHVVLISAETSIAVSEEKYLELNNGFKIPRLGLGTWHAKHSLLENALDVAFDAGYRFIDTAIPYGSEVTIGNVIKQWIDSGKLNRSDFFICTKLPSVGNRPERVQTFLNESLKNLQLNYVDLYLIHTPFGFNFRGEGILHPYTLDGFVDLDVTTDIVAVWKAMEEQVDAGLTKSIGLSNFNKSQVERILNNSRITPANLQIELHLYFQQEELVTFCQERGIIVTAYSPLRSPGSMYGKNGDPLSDSTIENLTRKYNKTAAQILLRHCIQKGISCIPKSVTPERIRENIDIFNFQLTSEDMQLLKLLNKEPEGRVLTFTFARGIISHPEYPFDLRYVTENPLNITFK